MCDDCSVQVAVRIRPQVAREVIDVCRICTEVPPGEPQVFLGPDKAFTYDYVFDTHVDQQTIYDKCVAHLVEGALNGFNATVFAYGQTGSGKTYTMGTGFDVEIEEDIVGIIPRAIHQLFDKIAEKVEQAQERGQMLPDFKVTAQFLELYNEDVKDLLEPGGPRGGARIHEDSLGMIHVTGVSSKVITSPEVALEYLRLGALSRTTGSTQMNTQSSRSHAIFTVNLKQQRCVKIEDPDADIDTSRTDPATEFETLTAKFHFVDLAGSERLKRTGATGERAKEGISINCGLLALGNVISALGDKSKKALHIPYRDSKLTRLLQDSLGGNSQTVMIACVSPSDRDFMETLSTLKYANRARNIKNKVTINQDKSSRTIASLRREIQQLQIELMEYRQGKRLIDDNGINDAWHENQMLNSELQNLRTRVKALSETVEALTAKNVLLLAEKATGQWLSSSQGDGEGVTKLVQDYVQEVEELRARLLEAEAMYQQLKRRQIQMNANNSYADSSSILHSDSSSILIEAKRDLEKEIETLANLKKQRAQHDVETAEKEEYNEANETGSGQESSSEEDSADDAARKGEDEEEAAMGRQLETLTSDIDVKQRLINELELSQRRLRSMKQHYEDKLAQLQARIRDTQEERDKVLSSLQQHPVPPTEKAKRLRDEYEKKLSAMQKEVQMLQSAKKEHTRLLRSQSQNENRLQALRNDLAEMKRAKVKLLNKMREEAQRHKENELMRNREIAKLRKESRKNANTIRSLEAEKKMKEVVLRRKQEEVTALRKRDRGFGRKVFGRTPAETLGPKVLKQRWQTFERTVTKLALAKQAATETEREMERLLREREHLGRELDRLLRNRSTLIASGTEVSAAELDEEIDNVRSKVSYLQESIAECQRDVMQIGDGDEEGESQEEPGIESLVATIRTVEEARYLLKKMLNLAVEQACTAVEKQIVIRDMESQLNEVVQESEVQHQLLKHVLRDRDLLSLSGEYRNESTFYSPTSTRSCSPDNSDACSSIVTSDDKPKNDKIRRRMAQPQELLFGIVPDVENVNDQPKSYNHSFMRLSSTSGNLK
ncbi:kinesin-like protein KIF21A [Orussus abietinus]|uniref:kinesin-like protein KIF21A n=1 Tax=Orussus abietinus TaxID=222816 RepID=UPI0006268753|nr:kinesin-like protein KIF21A [Orussus abietinus]